MPPARSILVYDGACGFCTWIVSFVRARSVEAVDVVPWQRANLDELGLSEADAKAAAWWVDVRGEKYRAARAVARALRALPFPWKTLGSLLEWPVIRWWSDAVYAWVSRHRARLPGTTPALGTREGTSEPSSHD